MPLRAAVLALLAFMVSLQGLAATPILLNEVAGRVGDQWVTVQDAYIFRTLQRMRTGTKPLELLERDQALAKTVQKVMFEQMLVMEARAIDFKEESLSELKRLQKLVETNEIALEWQRFLKKYGLSTADAWGRVRMALLAERFLKKKLENLTPVIAEAEIEQFIKNNPEKVKNLTGDKRAFVAEAIKKDRVDKGLQDYIDFLVQKYNALSLLKE
ncbi:hypothetical protein EBR78_08595 [bacterium]|nr:hypothetical protein [bacterium]